MGGFEFVFSLFAIILGLSLVEVLTGFSRALKRRRVVHLGWLVPLLAIFVMLDLASFWDWAWGARSYLTPSYGVLFIGLVVSGLYYLAASIVFPGEFGDRADFDAHYMAHHRQVLGAVLASNLIGVGWVQAELFRTIPLDVWITIAAYYALLVIGIATSNKRLSIGVLAALILLYLYSAVEALIVRPAF
jgi:hypothetical protein